jgi:thymidylate kinase
MTLKTEDESEGNIPWFVLDARKSIEEIHAEIVAITNKTIQEVSDKPISRLWLKK